MKKKASSEIKTLDKFSDSKAGASKSDCLDATDFIMNFEPDDDFTVWGYYDANEDDNTWGVFTGAGINGTDCAGYRYSSTNAADDYLFSPCFSLEAGKSYEAVSYTHLTLPTKRIV